MLIEYPYDDNILKLLQLEKNGNVKNGFYHYIQIQFAYNSNHIEGSTLTPEQTELIFDKGRIAGNAKVNEVIETANHFRMFDYILDTINEPLTTDYIRNLHRILRQGIDDDAGQYKKYQNQIGNINPVSTTAVANVAPELERLVTGYREKEKRSFEDIIEFHSAFEKIHPFQDGNGRTGRGVLFRECIRNSIMPVIVYDSFRQYYISGLNQWRAGNKQQLSETLNACQEIFFQNFRYFIGAEEKLLTSTYKDAQFTSETSLTSGGADTILGRLE